MLELARRSLMAGLAAASVIPVANAQDSKFAKDKLRVYARVRGAPKGQAAMWWYTGKLWGKRNLDAAVQFFRVDGFSFNRMEMQPDGTLIQKMVEVGFWNDPTTGKPADDWTNPITGLPCRPKHYKSSQAFTFTSDGQSHRHADAAPTQAFNGVITDPIVSGDTLWIGEDLILKATPPQPQTPIADPLMNVGPVVTATSLVNYTAKTKDLEAPDAQWVPATMNFQTMGSWYPWMRMGNEPGNIMFQLVGRKLRRSDEMPLALQALINERHPGFLENPGV
ncbi:MAG: DUF1838 family protein [Rhodospirillaceae bacterium]|nr:DUF1838 family protein [Rhodospirillaceae bacterium]